MWKEQQAEVFSGLKLKESAVVLAGDGRCDSLGHCAKYCTYTLLDVESQKVVDFKVVAVRGGKFQLHRKERIYGHIIQSRSKWYQSGYHID